MRFTNAPWGIITVSLVSIAIGVGIGLAVGPLHTATRTTTIIVRAPGVTPATAPNQTSARHYKRQPAPPPISTSQAHTKLSFSGSGPRTLGTLTIASPSILKWTSSRGRFAILYDNGATVLNSTAHAGHIFAPGGTYHKVKIRATGTWTLHTP